MELSRRVLKITSGCVIIFVAALLISFQVRAQSGGAILLNVRAGGQPAKAKIVVLSTAAEPEKVAQGHAGSPISVPAGTYDVEVTCTELVDQPTQQLRAVQVTSETVEREVTFPAGTITLHVRRGGRVLKGTTLHFSKVGGDKVAGTAKTGIPFKLSPGQYEAEIIIGGGRSKMSHSITGIQVYDGATRNIPVSL